MQLSGGSQHPYCSSVHLSSRLTTIIINNVFTDNSITESVFPDIEDHDSKEGRTDGAVNYLSVACEMASR
jgi:hypothetical protein